MYVYVSEQRKSKMKEHYSKEKKTCEYFSNICQDFTTNFSYCPVFGGGGKVDIGSYVLTSMHDTWFI